MSPPPLTPAVFHVLLSLAEEPRHGYAIMKEVELASGMSMGPGTVYGSLRRLADAGFVKEARIDQKEGDPRRTTSFRITSAGLAALAAEARRITGLAALERVRRLADGGVSP